MNWNIVFAKLKQNEWRLHDRDMMEFKTLFWSREQQQIRIPEEVCVRRWANARDRMTAALPAWTPTVLACLTHGPSCRVWYIVSVKVNLTSICWLLAPPCNGPIRSHLSADKQPINPGLRRPEMTLMKGPADCNYLIIFVDLFIFYIFSNIWHIQLILTFAAFYAFHALWSFILNVVLVVKNESCILLKCSVCSSSWMHNLFTLPSL